jgi:hypothetical protein
MANNMTFQEIYEAVMVAIGDAQYSRTAEVKAACNMIYLNEVNQCDDLYPLFWLLDCDDSKVSKVRAAITAISKAAQGSVTSAGHGFASGDVVTLYGIGGMTELNYRTVVIVKTTADAYTMTDLNGTAINTTNFTTYTSGGYAHHRGITLTDCNRVLKANWHGYDKGLDFIGIDKLENEAAWMDASVTRPQKCLHRKIFTAAGAQTDFLLWYQAADAAYNLRVWTEKLVDRLSATSDVPIGPPQVGDAIVAGAVMRLGENKVQVEAGIIWPSVYKSNIDAIRTLNRRWWQTQKQDERSGLFLP